MEVWGITGLGGSGKTTAVSWLNEQGYPALNLDQESSRLMDRNTSEGREGFERLLKAFGSEILDKTGNLDRRALFKRITLNPSDKDKLQDVLNPLLHALVEKKRTEWKSLGHRLAFVEGSRLVEAKLDTTFKGLIYINTTFDNRAKRLAKRDTMGKLEVEAMLRMQDNNTAARVATQVMENNGTKNQFEKALDQFVSTRLSLAK